LSLLIDFLLGEAIKRLPTIGRLRLRRRRSGGRTEANHHGKRNRQHAGRGSRHGCPQLADPRSHCSPLKEKGSPKKRARFTTEHWPLVYHSTMSQLCLTRTCYTRNSSKSRTHP